MEQIGTTRDGRKVLTHGYRTGFGLVFGLRGDMYPGERHLLGQHYASFAETGCLDAPAAMPAGGVRAVDEWRSMREAEQITALRGGPA